jgi:mRNA interferase HigB
MRVIALSAIKTFLETPAHADSKAALLSWYTHVLHAAWRSPADVKAQFGTASVLKNSRVVFNIAGNKYRLVTKINYPHGVVYIRFIGTHRQYNLIDAETV